MVCDLILEVRGHEDKGLLTEEVHELEDDVFDEKEPVPMPI